MVLDYTRRAKNVTGRSVEFIRAAEKTVEAVEVQRGLILSMAVSGNDFSRRERQNRPEPVLLDHRRKTRQEFHSIGFSIHRMKPKIWRLVAFVVAVASVHAGERVAPSAARPTVAARFGEVLRDDIGTLQYPGFTVRLQAKATFSRDKGQRPWFVWTYQVLNEGHLTIGGDIVFNSDERVNGRRFDVAGHIYIAEKHASVAGLPPDASTCFPTSLGDDEIVIWDRASAEARNPILARIWQTEKIEANVSSEPSAPGRMLRSNTRDARRSSVVNGSVFVSLLL
jgi:hypothetical protein